MAAMIREKTLSSIWVDYPVEAGPRPKLLGQHLVHCPNIRDGEAGKRVAGDISAFAMNANHLNAWNDIVGRMSSRRRHTH